MQASSNPNSLPLLDELVKVARERSEDGNATIDDWRSIARIDTERARRELSDYLQSAAEAELNANPYVKHPSSVGTVVGFISGCLLMAFMWNTGVPYLQDAWAGIEYGPGFATAITYVSTVFLPLGAWLGARWERARRTPKARLQVEPRTDGTFEELLQRFCRVQNRARARVY